MPFPPIPGALLEALGDSDERDPSAQKFTVPFDFSGNPTLSLPCGFTDDGLPLSLQLVARHLDEELLCRAGFAFEQATEWHTHHPNVG
jgi:amidase